jgi:hypothetical protein
MATSYNRRINLYINGQQVTNDIASIRAEMNKTINTHARKSNSSEVLIAETSKIKSLKQSSASTVKKLVRKRIRTCELRRIFL